MSAPFDMDYADVVLAAMVVAFALTISVLVALGVSSRISTGVGSLAAAVVAFHALFFNPPRRGRSR